ncbi:MAG: hypothetical protein C4K49_05825 [Candidatus Thorarchaeota archaeon]|nr:MAG: hypothetical protein C4K49_05825 [Candidatus Thorarchaeota archaeon]
MNRSLLAILSAVVIVVAVLAILWILGLSSMSDIFGGLGGAVGGVLGVTYMRRFQDERFRLIMSLAARNAFVFLLIILPLSSLVLIRVEEVTLQIAAGLIFVPWISSLVILYVSLFYYYRR